MLKSNWKLLLYGRNQRMAGMLLVYLKLLSVLSQLKQHLVSADSGSEPVQFTKQLLRFPKNQGFSVT